MNTGRDLGLAQSSIVPWRLVSAGYGTEHESPGSPGTGPGPGTVSDGL
jgi:hypothetical protein